MLLISTEDIMLITSYHTKVNKEESYSESKQELPEELDGFHILVNSDHWNL